MTNAHTHHTLLAIVASFFAVVGLFLPMKAPTIQQEIEPPERVEEEERSGDDDPPEGPPQFPVNEKLPKSSPLLYARDTESSLTRSNVFRELSPETVRKLEEISHEPVEDLFESREKHEAMVAGLKATIDSLHVSRSARGNRVDKEHNLKQDPAKH